MQTHPWRVERLVLRVQRAFLENPALRVTLPQAERTFGVDAISCDAVLAALVDAGVLTRSADGSYTRYFPHYCDAA